MLPLLFSFMMFMMVLSVTVAAAAASTVDDTKERIEDTIVNSHRFSL